MKPTPLHYTETSFASALTAPGPSPEIPLSALIYAPLIGRWKVVAMDYAPDGSTYRLNSEWFFSWVLEGRGVQDVWIAPERMERFPGMTKDHNRYGTTIRVYDGATQTWKMDWINPVRGVHNQLLARKVGEDIVQEGKDTDGSLMRWTFHDIKPDSFRWSGEVSKDGGKTWILQAEFHGQRM